MNPVVLLLLAIGAVAHLPFIIPQMRWMWDSAHYGFFPFGLAAFAWLVWERLRGVEFTLVSNFNKRTVLLLACNVMLLALATLARSHWLGWVSFIIYLWTVAHIVLPPEVARRTRAPFLILLVIVPLPLNLDTSLVIQLQKLATRQGSLLLDYFGIRHAVSGVAIRLPQQTFMVDDACSGIHSLFSGVAAMIVFAVYFQYGSVRTLATVLQTVFWVLVVNSLRVFTIVYTQTRWQLGLDKGLRHQALGFACYVVVLLLALSTDQAIRYFARLRTSEEEARVARSTWRSRMSAWFDKPFSTSLARAAGLCFALTFLLVGGIAVAQILKSSTGSRPDNFAQELAFQFTAEDMPEVVNGWQRVGFEAVSRESDNVFGQNSMVWTYERDGVTAQFSIDGAYYEFHDLYYCYSANGWNLRRSGNIPIGGFAGQVENAVATELELYSGESKQAQVLFTCVDAAGQVVEPPAPAESVIRKLLDRLMSGQLWGESEEEFVPPVIQFQAIVVSQTEFFESEREDLRQLFGELREAASRRILESNSAPQSASL